ncbi:MAG: hypothetical protein HUU55_10785 [Myxococcales bacterium]|nr:hypothetical protein [Myxococcales bacterium]
MIWDSENLTPEVRRRMHGLGRQFTSEQTRNQATATLQAYAVHKDTIAEYGFGPEMGEALQSNSNKLQKADLTKLNAKAGGKNTSVQLRQSVRKAKKTRRRAVGVLRAVADNLDQAGTKPEAEAATEIRSTLEKIVPTGDDATSLQTELETLEGTFAKPLVAEHAKNLGGPGTVVALQEAISELKAKVAAHKKGVPLHMEQETLDVIDGLTATLCRHARAAARAAASDLEQPALAKDFELTHLYY